MPRIIEKILEPSRIEVGSVFKMKIKVEDFLVNKRLLTTENRIKLITESGKAIRSDWGD